MSAHKAKTKINNFCTLVSKDSIAINYQVSTASQGGYNWYESL